MKTKSYSYGDWSWKTYLKKVGSGWETGFLFDGKPIFVGNFIYPQEASRWYALMNREISSFAKTYKVGSNFPAAWFKSFFSNHLYRFYYAYLDKLFAKYNRSYQAAVSRDVRRYKQFAKKFSPPPSEKPYQLRSA